MDRLLRSVVPALVGVVVLGTIVMLASSTPDNPDTYFHLRFGHEFLSDWSPWSPGSVSALDTRDWVPTQWLSEIGLAAVEDLGGLPALATLYGVLLVSLAVLWYVSARREASPLVSVLVTLVALLAAAPGLSLRPQVLSFGLATVTVMIWNRARLQARVPWVLIPLCWLWAMLHGMWILGVFVSLGCAVGLLLERKVRWPVLLVPTAMFGVAALTPAGPALIGAVLSVNSRAKYFPEWAAPDFVSTYGVAVLALIAIAIVPVLLSGPAETFDVLLTVAAVVLAVYSQRTVPVAAAVLLPLAARRLQALQGPLERTGGFERYLVVGAAALSIIVTAVLAPQRASAPPPPATAFTAELGALPAGTRILTDYSTGGFVMWAHPDLDVPVHGYGDLYTDAELEAFNDLFQLEPGWDRTVRADGFSIAVLPPSAPLTAALESHGWQVTGRTDQLLMLEDAHRG